MPSRPKYTFKLTDCEREEVEQVISAKVCGKEQRLRAYIILKSDDGQAGGSWPDAKIMEAYSVSSTKVHHTRKNMVEHGLEIALNRKKRLSPPRPRKLDGEKEAHLIALACSDAPEGHSRWTLSLLQDKLVQLKIVDSISKECVRETLKKMNLSLG